MALDPSIALGVRPLQLPDPLAQMAQVSQIQAAQRQNEMAQMQLEQLKQDRMEMQDFQRQLTQSGGNPDLDLLAKTMLKSPKYFEKGVELTKKLKEQADYEAYLKRQQPATGAAAPRSAPAPMNALAASAGASPQPSVNALSAGPTLADLQSQYREVSRFSAPGAKAEAELLKEQIKALQTPREVAGRLVTGAGQVLFEAPDKGTELQRNYEYAKKQGFKGNIFDYEREIKLAGRTPAQPVAPTIAQIVDPANPNQMITVDARRYQGGSVGSPGVIGVGGKEPGAALRTNKVEAGKTQLADDLDNLRASFQTLDQMRAIPSTERGALSNVASGIAATGVGQKTGQLFGTEAQVERDVINSARSRLVNSIKNATGMSAQQLNSNVELQTMLKSISDPGQSVQAALRIIDDIENAYVKGDGMLPKRNKPGAAPAAVSPNIDALLKKYEK